ncbi:Phosphatidylglycerol--membrane-oligosaccharide glycerophosphotransferase [hydrothermal vent metagenome]|uniref:Phosphatidylglycerol--membrane-oligosaccharide glycerophosphotransferase n=1 Tax=hydrothermal vent metagenome TaxID=652676 RepID=A0A3B0X1J0_9ZZZZ
MLSIIQKKEFFSFLHPARELWFWWLTLLAIFTSGRVVFFIYFYERIKDSDSALWLTFVHGFRMDIISACALLLLPAIILLSSPVSLAKISNQILKLYFLIVILIAIYMEHATLPFINEYDVRPNVIFINYLKYPKEVLATIWPLYKLELFFAFLMMAVATYWLLHRRRISFMPVLTTPVWKRLVLLLPVMLVLVIGVRSSFGHRPANPSDAIYSGNRLLNEVTKNTLHSVLYAVYSDMKHGGSAKIYGSMKQDVAFNRVRKRLHIASSQTTDSPFRRVEKSHFESRRAKNLVILLEESLGAQFVGSLNPNEHRNITPNIDKLSQEGIFFKKLYSNGTRSIRGISGTVAGFLATPGKGVVKRNQAQKDFFTIAQLLEPRGYKRSFFYGGESRFDNMRSWFSGNGFNEIYDEASFNKDDFHGTWGVDDVTVVEKADAYYKNLSDKGENFVSVIFSTTNHKPFDFPAGRIELVEGVPEKSVENAIKYADYAIGHFIDLAKKSGYYEDTIFLVIADHNIRVYGDDILPVDMFHIPGLIIGGGIEPVQIDSVTSQPDLLATVLDLMGESFEYPILGKSVFSENKSDVSLLQFHDIYGLRYKNEIAVFQPGTPVETYLIDKNDRLRLTKHNVELEKDNLAFITTLDALYQKKLFH